MAPTNAIKSSSEISALARISDDKLVVGAVQFFPRDIAILFGLLLRLQDAAGAVAQAH